MNNRYKWFIFFVAFMLYYYVNWKYLSAVWPLR